MSATDVLESEILNLIFLNDNFDNIGDATGIVGSTTPGNLELSLHTATLTDTATQTTSEAAYGSYARVDEPRNGANWTEAAGQVTNDAALTFPQASSGSETETYFGVGSDVVANELWIYGALTSGLAVSSGITPEFAISALQISVT